MCTVSKTTKLVVQSEWLKAGARIKGIGAVNEKARESGLTTTLKCGKMFVDQRKAVLCDTREIAIPTAEQAYDAKGIAGEIGSVFSDDITGR